MTGRPAIGLIKVRGHCLFSWREPEDRPGERLVDILPDHCEACIDELQNVMGPRVQLIRPDSKAG